MPEISKVIATQRTYFDTGKTRSLEFRVAALKALKESLQTFEQEILEALRKDLHKPTVEAYLSEIGFLYEEIQFALKNLKRWVAPLKQRGSFLTPLSQSWIQSEPLGVVLIIGPWNYPFQLLLSPLVGAIAAGNCVVLKPSELAPKTSRLVARLIAATFPAEFISVAEGGVETSQTLLNEKWDHIFFTGGTQIGKKVMAAAANHLTPVTLELGGKSPCIVDEVTDLDATARRIVWGKFMNAGQTCVAPDYLLTPSSIKTNLVERIGYYLKQFFGEDPKLSEDYGRIVNRRHFDRLLGLIDKQKVVLGGDSDAVSLYLGPTLMTGVTTKDKVMEDEIFGPILPLVDYRNIEEAIRFVKQRPKPLALYFFGKCREHEKRILEEISFGGGCVNDTIIHLGNPRLPFGGVGDSGMGSYHGKFSFETFSHKKSMVRRSFLIDPMMRYPPYRGKLSLFKKLLG